jgi:hypothetical protein
MGCCFGKASVSDVEIEHTTANDDVSRQLEDITRHPMRKRSSYIINTDIPCVKRVRILDNL